MNNGLVTCEDYTNVAFFGHKFTWIWCLKYCDFCEIWDFEMWFLRKMIVWKCGFCEKWASENAIFVENGLLKCNFCEKWYFEKAIFVKNVILKRWIMLKIRFWKCEFLEICEFFEIYDFEQVIFWIQCGFLPQCASTEIQLGPDCQMANYVTKEVQSLYM